jgi:hypothetical protein
MVKSQTQAKFSSRRKMLRGTKTVLDLPAPAASTLTFYRYWCFVREYKIAED